MAEDSGPCGEEQEEIKSWILSRIQAAREEGGLGGCAHGSFSSHRGSLLVELPAGLMCVDKIALGFSNLATVTLASRSLFVRAGSASLGTDSSQPCKAQPQTLGLAKQQLFQKPIVGGCCCYSHLLLLVFTSQGLLHP